MELLVIGVSCKVAHAGMEADASFILPFARTWFDPCPSATTAISQRRFFIHFCSSWSHL